jgi:hypothetical protein
MGVRNFASLLLGIDKSELEKKLFIVWWLEGDGQKKK